MQGAGMYPSGRNVTMPFNYRLRQRPASRSTRPRTSHHARFLQIFGLGKIVSVGRSRETAVRDGPACALNLALRVNQFDIDYAHSGG